jgi:Uma2 family endonuclease
MSIATHEVETKVATPVDTGEQSLTLGDIGYVAYESIASALGEKAGVRLVYVDGRLTFLTASRRHDWYAERLAELVKALASATGLNWEDSGSATYRLGKKEVGVEADKAFYFGTNADRMQGSVNIDLETQPPPDLTIEVEFTNPADDAMIVYGRIGVPEVWRFDVKSWKCSFWHRNQEGSYDRSVQSRAMPFLKATDVEEQLRLADAMGAARWSAQLPEWVRATILPRAIEG